MGIITFNGISSDTYGIVVERVPDYETPAKKSERIHIPGRNGDILIESEEYDNVDRSYDVAIIKEGLSAEEVSRNLSKWLHQPGYCTLEDTYQPDIYMKAFYAEESVITNVLGAAGRATITFNRMPQRFLKSGLKPIEYTNPTGNTIKNPTNQKALPQVKIFGSGSGTVTMGVHEIKITTINGYVVVDSVIEDVYKDFTNMNGYATITNGFPEIVPYGSMSVKFTGGITKVEITPNWWVI